VVALNPRGVEPVEVVGAQLSVRSAGAQDVVDYDQQAVRHGDHGLVPSAAPSHPVELDPEGAAGPALQCHTEPDLEEAAFVEQAKGMSDAQLRAALLDYEIKHRSRQAWAPSAKRLVGARWWLKGGNSSVIWHAADDRKRYEMQLRKAPPEV
jgi:hypothetical protein